MVAPALRAVAEAGAGHAATPLAAAKGLRIILPAVPALAPRFNVTSAMVCLRAREEIFPLLNNSCKLSMDNLLLRSLGVFSYSPTFFVFFFCCSFQLFWFIFAEQMSLACVYAHV